MMICKAALEKTLIAAHRGVASGNVPCNSFPAFEAALRQGADMIELDVSLSADGKLYVFHPGMESVFLRSEKLISQMDSAQVDALVLHNQDATPTPYRVPRLEEALCLLKGRCFINIDKFWTCPERIAAQIREMGMQDQVLIKTSDKEEDFQRVEEVAADLPYMVIARDRDWFSDGLAKRNLRYAGVEALFSEDDAPICSEEYIRSMNERNLLVWANSIIYNYKAVLAAGHSDDVSVSDDPDKGWGWLVKRGFNIIQTDWPLALSRYLGR